MIPEPCRTITCELSIAPWNAAAASATKAVYAKASLPPACVSSSLHAAKSIDMGHCK